jgi:hypothetical protein
LKTSTAQIRVIARARLSETPPTRVPQPVENAIMTMQIIERYEVGIRVESGFYDDASDAAFTFPPEPLSLAESTLLLLGAVAAGSRRVSSVRAVRRRRDAHREDSSGARNDASCLDEG